MVEEEGWGMAVVNEWRWGGDEGEKDWDGTWKWLVVSFFLFML